MIMSNSSRHPDELDFFVGTPYQTHSPTSLAGAIAAAPRAPSQMRLSYDYITDHPRTSQEGVWLGLRAQTGRAFKERTIGARVVELHQAGLLVIDGEVTNVSGEQAEAYRVCRPFPDSGVVRRGPGALAQANAEIARLRALCVALGGNPDEGVVTTGPVDPNDPFLDGPDDA